MKKFDLPPPAGMLEPEDVIAEEDIFQTMDRVLPKCKMVLAIIIALLVGTTAAEVFPPHTWLWPLLGIWQ